MNQDPTGDRLEEWLLRSHRKAKRLRGGFVYRLERSLFSAFPNTSVHRRELFAFCLVILGAFTSVGSIVAFGHDSTLKSQLLCGTADALQPVCGQNFVSYDRIYPLAIIGAGATFVGFYIASRLDLVPQPSSRF